MECTETSQVHPHCPRDLSEELSDAVTEPAAGSAEGEKPPPAAGRGRNASKHASSTDGVFASIDARLKAQMEVLERVSSRMEAQLEDQKTNFAQMIEAINNLQSRGLAHEIGSSPQALMFGKAKAVKLGNLQTEDTAYGGELPSVLSAISAVDTERNENVRGSSKASTWSRGTARMQTAPSPTPSIRSASRTNTAPTTHHVQDLADDRSASPRARPQRISERSDRSVLDDDRSVILVQDTPSRQTTPTAAPGAAASGATSLSNHLRMPISIAIGKRKDASDAERKESEAHADTPTVTKMLSTKSFNSIRSEAQETGNSNPSIFGDDAQPAGFQRASSMQTDMSRVIEVICPRTAGNQEEQLRAATLSAGFSFGTAHGDNEVSIPTFTVPFLQARWGGSETLTDVKIPTMLAPGSKVHIVVAVLMGVAIVYTGFLSPIVLAHFQSGRIPSRWTTLMYIADTLWLVFIAYGFRSATYDQRGGMVVDWRQIGKTYAQKWLFMDLLCAWPAFLAPAGTAFYSACMVLKLLRTPRLAPLISLLQKEHRLHALSPVKWGLIILLVSHSMACFWRMLQCDVESHIAPAFPDLYLYCEGNDWWQDYVSDMYWIAMTLSTVGYGDIYPYNTPARAYNIFVMLLSPVFFGSVVAALSNVMDKFFDEKVESQVAKMSRFMQRHNVSQQVQHRVERSLRQVLNNETNNEPLDAQLMNRLSLSLQKTFSFAILSSTIGEFPLFRGAIHSFVAELAQAFTLAHCSAGDLVGEAGQLVEELVFVVNGELVANFNAEWPGKMDVPGDEFAQAEAARRHDVQEALPARQTPKSRRRTSILTHQVAPGGHMVMRKGVWFGEACVVKKQHVRTATIVAQGHAELAVLTKKTHAEVMNRYPAMAQRHDKFMEHLSKGNISLDVLAWSEDPKKNFQRSDTWARRVSMEWLQPS